VSEGAYDCRKGRIDAGEFAVPVPTFRQYHDDGNHPGLRLLQQTDRCCHRGTRVEYIVDHHYPLSMDTAQQRGV
jgi:hypothetical protein